MMRTRINGVAIVRVLQIGAYLAASFFKDLRNDGLATGLRRDAGVAGGRCEQADGEFELLHG